MDLVVRRNSASCAVNGRRNIQLSSVIIVVLAVAVDSAVFASNGLHPIRQWSMMNITENVPNVEVMFDGLRLTRALQVTDFTCGGSLLGRACP